MQSFKPSSKKPIEKLSKQSGMALLAINIVLLVASLSLLLITLNFKQERQREREVELLFIGAQFASAIEGYMKPIDANGVQWPKDLNDLLLDTRAGIERRHLRRIYIDPMTGKQDWAVMRTAVGIVAVHSTSQLVPIRKAGFPVQQEAFANAKKYSEWIFQASLQASLQGPGAVPLQVITR